MKTKKKTCTTTNQKRIDNLRVELQKVNAKIIEHVDDNSIYINDIETFLQDNFDDKPHTKISLLKENS